MRNMQAIITKKVEAYATIHDLEIGVSENYGNTGTWYFRRGDGSNKFASTYNFQGGYVTFQSKENFEQLPGIWYDKPGQEAAFFTALDAALKGK